MAKRRLPKRWNELDWLIYENRITKGLTWRETAKQVGKSHEYCRDRLLRRLAEMPHAEVEAYRNAELERIDHREQRLTLLYAEATQSTRERTPDGDIVIIPPDRDAMLKTMKLLNDISKLRTMLLGLAKPTQVNVGLTAVDATQSIAEVVEAYTAGIADAAAVNAD